VAHRAEGPARRSEEIEVGIKNRFYGSGWAEIHWKNEDLGRASNCTVGSRIALGDDDFRQFSLGDNYNSVGSLIDRRGGAMLSPPAISEDIF
jgi:hypothetical protein